MKKKTNSTKLKKSHFSYFGAWTLFDFFYWPISVITGGGRRENRVKAKI
jgi:hypothetical protein